MTTQGARRKLQVGSENVLLTLLPAALHLSYSENTLCYTVVDILSLEELVSVNELWHICPNQDVHQLMR